MRNTCIKGICVAFILAMLFAFESERKDYFWLGYLAGVLFGMITGLLAIEPMKGRIVEGTLTGKRTLDRGFRTYLVLAVPLDFEFRTYWKSYLVIALSLVISCLLANELLHSMTVFFGFMAGQFAGIMLCIFAWVLLYEKRHNVGLTVKDTKP